MALACQAAADGACQAAPCPEVGKAAAAALLVEAQPAALEAAAQAGAAVAPERHPLRAPRVAGRPAGAKASQHRPALTSPLPWGRRPWGRRTRLPLAPWNPRAWTSSSRPSKLPSKALRQGARPWTARPPHRPHQLPRPRRRRLHLAPQPTALAPWARLGGRQCCRTTTQRHTAPQRGAAKIAQK